jgi:predicted Zn-ribbon and HTH transcriptional regulator
MIELQDIFLQYGDIYRQNHKLPKNIYKAMSAIEKCRTSALGGHSDACDECGYTKISYNSCRNRHCPKCQTLSKERWIEARKEDLLNVKYFHAVFTIPDTLNTITFQNQKIVYNILFKSVAETLLELSADKKYLGVKLGFTSILHTWGQNLMHHPHIHCVIPGGGLSPIAKWIYSRKKFFIPVKVLSRKFRGKFLFYLKQAYDDSKLSFYGSEQYLTNSNCFSAFLTTHYDKEWIVYCKPPFRNAGYVVEYLGRYTHRVAISNTRIVNVENGCVTFNWRDYKDNNKQKLMTVSAEEFIRRFLIHILPDRLTKIRHYGLLGNRNKKIKLKLCKQLTNTPIRLLPKEPLSAKELIKKLTGKDFSLCPCCGIGHLSRAAPS